MVLSSLFFGYFILRPEYLADLGQSTVFASLQLSNIWFWYEIDYFDRDALTKPLLHTWSLSVEEQIYFLLFLYAIVIRKTVPALLWLFLIFVSFIFAQLVYYFDEQIFFYATFARIPQFMAGWMLSRSDFDTKIKVFLGLGVTFAGAFFGNMFFISSGLSVLGIIFLSSFRHRKFISFLARCGRPTYSLYLVHYPISVFLVELGVRVFPVTYVTAYFVGTVALGYALFFFVKKRITQ